MTPLRHQIAWLLFGTTAAVVCGGEVVRAQDDAETEQNVEAPRPEDLQILRVEQQRQRLQMAYKAQYDRWISFQFRPRVGTRDQLEMRLAGQLRELEEECHLTTAQVKKLKVAGRGDIKRFMDRVNHIAKTMEDPRSSIDDLRAARLDMVDLDTRAGQRLFGDDSLLGKTLASTLDPDQAAARERAFLERNVVRHRRAVNAAIQTLQSNLGMTDAQCTRLAELLLSETRPPRRFGNAPDVALVLFQASRVPEARIRPIFDDGQWRIMGRWMRVYARVASGKETLKRNGFVFDDESADEPPDRVKPVSKKDMTTDVEQNHRD
jgi:hypothetical protein